MQKESTKENVKSIGNYFYTFLKWCLVSVIVGILCGIVGSLFNISVSYAREFRLENGWMIFLLPIAGIIITFLYQITKMNTSGGTDEVIASVREKGKISFLMAPLIFIATVLTHFCGGSAGREGAALQLGGSIGSNVGKLFRFNDRSMRLFVMAGMAGVFSAVFGTPLTATLFALEVISVGIMHYSAFLPCLLTALTAYGVAELFHIEPERFLFIEFPSLDIIILIKVVILAVLCAGVSILFCLSLKKTKKYAKKYIKNPYVLVVLGGIVIIILSLIFKSGDYNGAGMQIIEKALQGEAKPEAFLLKIIFTSITIAVGFKGGEIVPTFFIGATFGCVMASVLGLESGVGAAIGLIALFCAVTNCPLASIILSVELFGAQGLLYFACACGVSYMLSGYYGLYKTQKIMYSKLRTEFVSKDTR